MPVYLTLPLGRNFGNHYFDTVVQFNDTLCLIHEKTDTMIVCWISGDAFDDSTTSAVRITSSPSLLFPLLRLINSVCCRI